MVLRFLYLCQINIIKIMGILYVYLSGNIKYWPAGWSSHENRPASIFFGQKKWQKSRKSQFFRRLVDNLISVHFCSRELSQTPNGRIDNGKFFIFWYHIFHILWMSDQNMVSFADIRYFLILLKDFLNNAKMWKSNTDFDLAPESEIMVQMSSDQGRWHLRSLNNFSINMVYP